MPITFAKPTKTTAAPVSATTIVITSLPPVLSARKKEGPAPIPTM